jgi:HEAT repeat protein
VVDLLPRKESMPMKLLPRSRKGRAVAAGMLAAVLGLGGFWYVSEYRPWEQPRYHGRPASWWDREVTRQLPEHGGPPPVPGWRVWLALLGLLEAPRNAFEELGECEPEAVPVLIALLDSPEAGTRATAAQVLGRGRASGPWALAALPALLRRLEDPDSNVRYSAMWSVRQMAPQSAPVAVAGLTALLDSPSADTRAMAAASLASISPWSRPALPALLRRLEDPDRDVRYGAGDAVQRLVYDEAPGAVDGIVALLGSPNAGTRSLAATILGDIGPYAWPALPALLRCRDDPDKVVRGLAERAVVCVLATARPARLAALAGPLAAGNSSAPCEVARLLWLGPWAAVPAAPALLRLLADPDKDVRRVARWALESTHPEALAAHDRDHPGAGREGGESGG